MTVEPAGNAQAGTVTLMTAPLLGAVSETLWVQLTIAVVGAP